jgi:hypothetical protein
MYKVYFYLHILYGGNTSRSTTNTVLGPQVFLLSVSAKVDCTGGTGD